MVKEKEDPELKVTLTPTVSSSVTCPTLLPNNPSELSSKVLVRSRPLESPLISKAELEDSLTLTSMTMKVLLMPSRRVEPNSMEEPSESISPADKDP